MEKLKIGDLAPDFCLEGVDSNCNEKKYCLKDLLDMSEKGIVLYFYPKDNTPGCTKEAIDFTSLLDKFKQLGYLVVGVSKDSIKSHCNFIQKQNLNLILLSDPEIQVMKKYGVWGEKKMYGKVTEGVIRSTFVINKEGKLEKVYYNVKATGHAERVLKDLT